MAASCRTAEVARRGPGYKYYVVGSPTDVVRPTRGLWVAQGGGDDVDANYVRMGEFGGGGDFVVLRASGTDDYNDYIYGLCHCDSVETIVFDKGAATADPFVIETIRNAEAVWIAGGDQSNYIRYWKDTPVEDAINFVAAKPAPVGGTSAGMAVLGEYVYSAEGKESLTSAVALGDPYAPDVTLARGFLSLPRFENIVTDQHLQERDRIGRTVALLSRLQKDGWSATSARDRGRSRDGAAHQPGGRLGRGFFDARSPDSLCLFPDASEGPPRCKAGEPLTTAAVEVYRLGPGGHFNLATWQGSGGIRYELSVRPASYIRRAESNY